MSGVDLEVREILDRFVPEPATGGDWHAVVADASLRRRRFAPLRMRVALAASIAAVAVLVIALASPFGGGSTGLLDRALAATGGGPVLHVVLEIHPDGWVVDLASGRRARPEVVFEQWFESGSELRERVIKSTGGAGGPVGVLTKRPDWGTEYSKVLAGFVEGYRDALRRGDAQTVEHGTVSGRAVAWIRFTQGASPGAAYEVAVDEKTGEPLYLRMSVEGRPDGHYDARVLELDSASDMPKVTSETPAARVFSTDPKGDVSPAQARGAMSRPALWLGSAFQGLPLSRLTLLEFAQAPGSLWDDSPKETWKGLDVLYGGANGQPSPTARFVEIEEQTHESVREGAPAEGSILMQGSDDGAGALLQKNGVYMLITGSSQELILEAAKALQPIP